MESTDSSTEQPPPAPTQPHLPPGFRFHPTDEELVVHYLKRKAAAAPLPVSIIAEVDLYKFDPWELPAKASFGEQEWYFFSPRDRKYPNGARPNRAATSGYWKATGTDKPVMTSGGTHKVGVKKALVFYGGKPPKGVKTNWIMHEYRLTDGKPGPKPPTGGDVSNKKASLRLDDWVLCRIYKKNGGQDKEEMSGARSDSGGYSGFLEMEGMVGAEGGVCKRVLQPPYWVDHGGGKRFLAEEGSEGCMAALLGQMPQTPPLMHQQGLLGSIGDGVFRQAYQVTGMMDWYS